MTTRRSRTYGEFDAATLRQAFAGPGMDTRQWISMGVVDADEGSQRAVRYDKPDYGTLVHVTLQPSGIQVVARVGQTSAGSGEGDFEPFSAGDEVVVAIPEGMERTGCVIISRLNNKQSPAPTRVAGTDIQNNVSGKRRISPYFIESATSIMLRVTTTESFLSLSDDGNVTLASGDHSYLHLGPDFVGLSNSDGSMVLQANASEGYWYIHANDDAHQCIFRIGGNQPGMVSSDNVYIGSNGIGPWQHLVTFEQVIGIICNILGSVGTTPTTPLSALAVPGTAATAILTVALASLAKFTPPEFLTPGSMATLRGLISQTANQSSASGYTGLATQIIAS